MHKKIFGGYLTKLIILLLALFAFVPAYAQNVTPTDSGLHITLSPHYLNLKTEPGKSVTGEMKIQNLGNNTETLQISLMKFTSNDNTGSPRILDREPGDDFFDWVSFSEEKFSVKPNEWKTITVTINPPASAAFGYYYVFSFSRAVARQPKAGEAVIEGAPSILGLVNVEVPGAKKEAKLVKIETDHKFYEYLPTVINATIQNTGDVHLAPSGTVFINKGGADIASLDINMAKGNILPKSERVFSVQWSEGFPQYADKIQDGKVAVDSQGNAVRNLKWDFGQISKLRIGKYTAHVLMVYDNGTKDMPLEGYVSFWVIPWKLIIALILLLALVVLGVWQIFRPLARQIFRNKRS